MEWHAIQDPNDPELDRLAAKYKLHPLHIEDCRHRNQSAKVEPQNGYLFVVLKTIQLDDTFCLHAGDVDFFVGSDFLITVEEMECSQLRGVLAKRDSAVMRPAQLFHRIMDAIVDSYPPILDRIDDEIDRMEDQLLADPDPKVLERLFDMKRTLIELRRFLANTRDVANSLLRNNEGLIGAELLPFFRDIFDHIARNLDMVEIQRDVITGVMDLYLSSVANRTNQVMKVLTILGTLATPAIVISGVYGMNLKHMPFSEHPHAAAIVTSLILGASAALMAILRWFRWF